METPLQEDWYKAEKGVTMASDRIRKVTVTNNQNKTKQSEAKTQSKTKTLSLVFLLQILQGLPFVKNKKQQPQQK